LTYVAPQSPPAGSRADVCASRRAARVCGSTAPRPANPAPFLSPLPRDRPACRAVVIHRIFCGAAGAFDNDRSTRGYRNGAKPSALTEAVDLTSCRSSRRTAHHRPPLTLR
ncbi:hypothetical protein EVAR_98258_1, partial [Eumeta japonica]